MHGWNFLAYDIGWTIQDAFGKVGIKNIDTVDAVQLTSQRWVVRTYQLAVHRNIVMKRTHVVADIWKWEMV